MGIRFVCDHCQHRLNVKQKQAGTVGLCVHCRQPVKIPLESTLPGAARTTEKAAVGSRDRRFQDSDHDSPPDESRILDVDDQITMDGLQAGEHESEPKSKLAELPRLQRTDATAGEPFNLGRPSPPPTFGKVDPIAEAPSKVWYFRTKGFGERGPLKAKAMQTHVDEGNVGIGSMVWREDWGDWVKAEEVFPEFVQLVREQRRQTRLQSAMEKAGLETMPTSEVPQTKKRLWMYLALTLLGLAIVGLLSMAAVRLISSDARQQLPPNSVSKQYQLQSQSLSSPFDTTFKLDDPTFNFKDT